MEFRTADFRPLVGSSAELAPYLAGLDVAEALQDFGRLADLVLSADDAAASTQWPVATSSLACAYPPSPSSPDGASLCSGAATPSSHWSRASSPLASDHSLSFSSSASPSSSTCSAFSSSAASSVCGDLECGPSCGPQRRRGSARADSRKRQNATAAERYRRKQRGRLSGLDEELERERARNQRLLQSFEAKLELYREFADLLASNTRSPSPSDLQLARLGSRSLANILERICPADFLASNEPKRAELERLRAHFRRVLSVGQFQARA